jgi:hypothetical protein
MTIFVRDLASGVGTGSLASIYPVPANTVTVVKKLTLNNTSAGALTYTLAVNDGTADRELQSVVPIAAHTAYSPTEINGLSINSGGIVKLNAPAGITYWLSGIEVTQ